MNRIKRLTAVLVYLLLICSVLDFQIVQLFDLKQILLVVAGAFCLYMPGIDWGIGRRTKKESTVLFQENQEQIHEEQKWFDAHRFARCALTASTLQTFIVFFILLSNLTDTGEILLHMALACRPVFYGICIWSIFGDKEEDEDLREEKPVELTAEMCYNRYLELGLSKREAEVALQVEKGLSNAEIAAELYISETTVKKHISNIFEKLGITKREEIIKKRTEN